MNDNTILQTSAAARLLGISARAVIDLFEKKKLPGERTACGHRFFRFRDVERLRIERDAARDARGLKQPA